MERIRKVIEKDVVVCPACGYEWEPRVEQPVKCPDCQARLRPGEVDRAPRAGQGAATNDAKETK